MRRLRSTSIVLALLSLSCSASYPTAPDRSIVGVQVLLGRAMNSAVAGGSYEFSAYAIRSDGAYLDVRSSASWESSDPSIMRPDRDAGSFEGVRSGQVDIAARYQGFVGVVSVTVTSWGGRTYPYLFASGADYARVGQRAPISLWLVHDVGYSERVTSPVTWKSANASIASVEGASVTGVQVGTTSISATYNGLGIEYWVSVHPSR